MFYLLDVTHRRITFKNIQLAFPHEPEKKRIARDAFANFGLLFCDLLYFYDAGPKIIKQYVKLSGVSHYQRTKEKGRGVLLLGAHLGNWELMAIAFALLICPVSIVVMSH
jgi:KDO2-lipid IV(A) lauroyltransferase